MNTPNANRLHIALYGKRNSGKSSLINALTGQDTAIGSDTPGTTTDLVSKAMEIHGIGPCLFIDTPGVDDEGTLGELRIERTCRRDDCGPDEVGRRIAAQLDDDTLSGRADYAIVNIFEEDLEPAVVKLDRIFSHEAARH